jgi:hypothetical protein
MSATVFGGEIKYTKRYRLGQLLSTLTRHFLLMTATPAQRQGRGLPALHGAARRRPLRGPLPRRRPHADVSDLMRRMVKEKPAQVRRHAASPRAHRLHGALQALRRRGQSLQGRHRLRARGVQPRRGAPERQARRHRRLRPDHPAASPGLLARGHLPIIAPPPRTAGKRLREMESTPARGPAGAIRGRRPSPTWMPKTLRIWKTRPRTRSRPPRRRSSTRPPPPAPSPS